MELLIIVALYIAISHFFSDENKTSRKQTINQITDSYREVEQSIEDAWRATDMTTVPADMLLAYRRYLKSEPWRKLRRIALKRDSYRCVRCGYIGNLQVHHTSYVGIYENFSFSVDQLESICELCHRDVHSGVLPMKKE